jgi:hypothetical protein
MSSSASLEGACSCTQTRYRLLQPPMFTNCCHCLYCQRESGSAFAMNAMIESPNFELLTPNPLAKTSLPTQSGKPQHTFCCPECHTVLYALYGDNGDYTRFVKVGTLREPARCPPDAHIFVASKQPWVNLEGGAPAFEAFYDRKKLWSPEQLERIGKVAGRMREDRAKKEKGEKL